MPRPSDKRVRVRNRHGAEKSVGRDRLPQLLAHGWTEADTRKRPAKPVGESIPAVVPDNDSQEG